MPPERRFRFGVIAEQCHAADRWVSSARRAEALGYDTWLVRDHFTPEFFGDQLAPVAALATAAAATSRLRIGTLVLDNDYRHPVVTAKEAATLDVLSGGRFELGLGAGWLRSEYERAGLPFDPPGVRIGRLEEALRVIKALFAGGPASVSGSHYRIEGLTGFPRPVQRPHPPILLGAGSPRMLRLAGREADIVGVLTSSTRTGTLIADPAERLADAVDQKLACVREGAGSRFEAVELSLVVDLHPSDDPHGAAKALIDARGWTGVTVADVLAMPAVLVGTVDHVVQALLDRRRRFGFSYHVVSDRHMEAFAPVVARLAGR